VLASHDIPDDFQARLTGDVPDECPFNNQWVS